MPSGSAFISARKWSRRGGVILPLATAASTTLACASATCVWRASAPAAASDSSLATRAGSISTNPALAAAATSSLPSTAVPAPASAESSSVVVVVSSSVSSCSVLASLSSAASTSSSVASGPRPSRLATSSLMSGTGPSFEIFAEAHASALSARATGAGAAGRPKYLNL
ncbi:Uncharacterised protein [Mycobacteroides abscessus subsp. abscessus]|nr:Uncharacterised protein [Mycobacteroides abscessus subsp. abscessus]